MSIFSEKKNCYILRVKNTAVLLVLNYFAVRLRLRNINAPATHMITMPMT